jgi:hypothetical protein
MEGDISMSQLIERRLLEKLRRCLEDVNLLAYGIAEYCYHKNIKKRPLTEAEQREAVHHSIDRLLDIKLFKAGDGLNE